MYSQGVLSKSFGGHTGPHLCKLDLVSCFKTMISTTTCPVQLHPHFNMTKASNFVILITLCFLLLREMTMTGKCASGLVVHTG